MAGFEAALAYPQQRRQLGMPLSDILGGNSIVLEYRIARHICDIEAIHTYWGTAVVQSLIVGRDLRGRNAFLPAQPAGH